MLSFSLFSPVRPCASALENLPVAQLLKNFPIFKQPERSLPCSQNPTFRSCPESDESV
jgi:hypothetical protein